MQQLPQSRFVLKSKCFASDDVKKRILDIFHTCGISSDRVDCLGLIADPRGHLSAYSLIDIALDTFPYSGTTTNCEAMHMGVPTMTLTGSCHAHNVGATLNHHVGLKSFIAQSEQEFVSLVAKHASDVDELSILRKTLRHQMAQSDLCNGKQFGINFGDALMGMWAKRKASVRVSSVH